jgi:hypothetical protein
MKGNEINFLIYLCLTPSNMITLLHWTLSVGFDGVHIGEVLLYLASDTLWAAHILNLLVSRWELSFDPKIFNVFYKQYTLFHC